MEDPQENNQEDQQQNRQADHQRKETSPERQSERKINQQLERAVYEPPEPDEPSDEPTGPSTSEDAGEGEPLPLPFPYVCVLMLVAIGIVFAAMLHVGQGNVAAAARLFGDKENSLIRAGQWWRLITPIFLHGNWGHIGANGLTLLMLGVPMERIYGARKFFLIYMLAGITGNLFSFWFSPIPSLGASGALYGLIGAGLVFPLRFKNRIDPRARKAILTQLARAALINLGINLIPGLNLDKWAHLGGLLGGGMAALVWMPDVLEEETVPRLKNAAVWTASGAMLALTLAAGVLQWQSARHPRVLVQTYYALESNDAWWGLLLPLEWRQAATVPADGVAWSGPDSSTLKIIDNRERPQLRQETQAFLQQRRAPLVPYAVDGKVGLEAVLREGDRQIELHQVETDGRTIAFIFSCPATVYAQMQPVFRAMMDTVRFVRPPRSALITPKPAS